MLKFDLKVASLAMSYLVTEERVRKLAFEKAEKEEEEMVPCENGIRISSAYYKIRSYEDLSDYIEDINSYFREARNEGAQILVFPQLMGMGPVTFMPGYKRMREELRGFFNEAQKQDTSLFQSLVESTQGFLGEIFFNTFSTLARCYKMIVAVGGFYHITDGRIYNTMYCFSETGEVIAIQDKLFLSPRERKWGVSSGDDISIAHSSLGKLALISSGGSGRYEPFFIANLMGASLCLVPTSPLDVENTGLVHRANENRQCIVVSGLDSTFLGSHVGLRQKSLIAVPYPFSLKKDGILRQGEKTVNTCMINLKKMKQSFDNYSADLNPEFLKEMVKY